MSSSNSWFQWGYVRLCVCTICVIVSISCLFQETSWRLKTKRGCSTPITSPCGTKGQRNKSLVPSCTLCLSTQVSSTPGFSGGRCCGSVSLGEWHHHVSRGSVRRKMLDVVTDCQRVQLMKCIRIIYSLVFRRTFFKLLHPLFFLARPCSVSLSGGASRPPLPFLLIPGCVFVDSSDCCGLKWDTWGRGSALSIVSQPEHTVIHILKTTHTHTHTQAPRAQPVKLHL